MRAFRASGVSQVACMVARARRSLCKPDKWQAPARSTDARGDRDRGKQKHPAPPGGRRRWRMSGSAWVSRAWPLRVMFGEEFILEQGAVVMEYLVLDAAVRVLVEDGVATTSEVPVIGDLVLVLAFLVVLRVHGPPARGPAV